MIYVRAKFSSVERVYNVSTSTFIDKTKTAISRATDVEIWSFRHQNVRVDEHWDNKQENYGFVTVLGTKIRF